MLNSEALYVNITARDPSHTKGSRTLLAKSDMCAILKYRGICLTLRRMILTLKYYLRDIK